MKFQPLAIRGAWLVESEVFDDERGSFREWFKSDEIKKATGIDFSVAQANVSSSNKGVIRGIHYSLAPEGQAKWITCVNGRILDLIIDIRPNSATFKEWIKVELNSSAGQAIFLEESLGHAFLALESLSTVSYLLNSEYNPSMEYGLHPLDSEIGIEWPVPQAEMIISPRDRESKSLHEMLATEKLPK